MRVWSSEGGETLVVLYHYRGQRIRRSSAATGAGSSAPATRGRPGLNVRGLRLAQRGPGAGADTGPAPAQPAERERFLPRDGMTPAVSDNSAGVVNLVSRTWGHRPAASRRPEAAAPRSTGRSLRTGRHEPLGLCRNSASSSLEHRVVERRAEDRLGRHHVRSFLVLGAFPRGEQVEHLRGDVAVVGKQLPRAHPAVGSPREMPLERPERSLVEDVGGHRGPVDPDHGAAAERVVGVDAGAVLDVAVGDLQP